MSEDTPPPRLVRAQEGRLISGVCGGLGRQTRIDAVVFRVGFAVLVLANGWGIVMYVAAALLMPGDPYAAAPLERLVKRRFDAGGVLTILGLLLCLGIAVDLPQHGVGTSLSLVAVLALALMVAQGRGVNLGQFVRGLPERLQGHSARDYPPPRPAPTVAQASGRPVTALPPGAVDLAALNPAPPLDDTSYSSYSSYADDVADQVTAKAHGRRRPGAVLGKTTFWLAVAAGCLMIPIFSGRPDDQIVEISLAVALAVVGCGLVISTWFGRARGLVVIGTLLSLTLVATSVSSDAGLSGGRFGEVRWRPIDPAQAEQTYKMIAGDGRLDLTDLTLSPGQRVVVHAEVGAGRLRVTLPATAQVELTASVGLGDVTVDHKVTSGPRAKVQRTLAPATATPRPPVIELHLRGRISDLEVFHNG
jgi:phage shock protein PspC (stress-responsive transcriptional regulator)/predicted membrane protein